MYLIIRLCFVCLCMWSSLQAFAQEKKNPNSFEADVLLAGDETIFYGANAKYLMPLAQKKHYPVFGLSLTVYADLKGESEKGAYLKNDVDLRIIPAINLGYSLNFHKVQLNFEVPVGTSIAVTSGTLVNERIGFEQDYRNAEFLWHYGLAFSPKYRLNSRHQIGLHGFMPLVQDKAASGYQFGIGWTKAIGN